MRFMPTLIHGVLDYMMGILLIAAPRLFGFSGGGAETWFPVIFGACVLLYSAFTDYELGVVRRLAMSKHLALDLAGGALLALSPWLFGFPDLFFFPYN